MFNRPVVSLNWFKLAIDIVHPLHPAQKYIYLGRSSILTGFLCSPFFLRIRQLQEPGCNFRSCRVQLLLVVQRNYRNKNKETVALQYDAAYALPDYSDEQIHLYKLNKDVLSQDDSRYVFKRLWCFVVGKAAVGWEVACVSGGSASPKRYSGEQPAEDVVTLVALSQPSAMA